MGTSLDRLAVRLAQVPIARHKRIVKGKVQDVESHLRKIDVAPGSPAPTPTKKKPEGELAKYVRKQAEAKRLPTSSKPGDSRDNPIVTGDVVEAASLLGKGKYVRLTSEDKVATLVHKLKEIVDDAKAKGKDAPKYDLCKVTVKNTNLFCVDTKGIPRVKMPQLGGIPKPGSPADKFPKNKGGEVDLSGEFAKFLTTNDVTGDGIPEVVDDTHQKASRLKASQNELGGAQVAAIATSMEEKGIDSDRAWLWTSNDDYVIDGHHRWAAMVAYGLGKGEDVDVPIHRVDMDIITILDVANAWTKKMGIEPAAVGAKPVVLART